MLNFELSEEGGTFEDSNSNLGGKQLISTEIEAGSPSLVITQSPISSTSILSRPGGPKEVLTMLAMAWTAVTRSHKDKREQREEKKERTFKERQKVMIVTVVGSDILTLVSFSENSDVWHMLIRFWV